MTRSICPAASHTHLTSSGKSHPLLSTLIYESVTSTALRCASSNATHVSAISLISSGVSGCAFAPNITTSARIVEAICTGSEAKTSYSWGPYIYHFDWNSFL